MVPEDDVVACVGPDGVVARPPENDVIAGPALNDVVASVDHVDGVGAGHNSAHKDGLTMVAEDHISAGARKNLVVSSAPHDQVTPPGSTNGIVSTQGVVGRGEA